MDETKAAQIVEIIKMCREADAIAIGQFAKMGRAKEPIGSFVRSSDFRPPKFSITDAILATCKDAGIKAVDFSDKCRPNMTVADFYRMMIAVWDHLAKSPGDAVFVSCDSLLTIECLDFMHRCSGDHQPLFDLYMAGGPVAMDPAPSRAVGWIYRNDDYCVITDTVKDCNAVKQVMKCIGVSEESSIECSICFADLYDGQNVVGLGKAKFICGHVICYECASQVDSCPTCREDKLSVPEPAQEDADPDVGALSEAFAAIANPDETIAALAENIAALAVDEERQRSLPTGRRGRRGRGRVRGVYR